MASGRSPRLIITTLPASKSYKQLRHRSSRTSRFIVLLEIVYATQHSTIIMSAYGTYYYSLPTEAPKRSRSGSRRPALSPSTVSSPCITTHAPIASRRDSAGSATSSGSPTKASVLLAKVVSSPPTPRGELPSPMASPETRMHSSYSPERPVVWRSESDRYVTQYRQQGKHHSQQQ